MPKASKIASEMSNLSVNDEHLFVMNCTSQVRDSRCDGNGYFCLPQGVCVCDSGWTAPGAFSTIDESKCDIHQNSVYVLNIIDTTLVVPYLLLISLHLIRISAVVYKEHKLIGKDTTVSVAAAMFAFFCFIGLSDNGQLLEELLSL